MHLGVPRTFWNLVRNADHGGYAVFPVTIKAKSPSHFEISKQEEQEILKYYYKGDYKLWNLLFPETVFFRRLAVCGTDDITKLDGITASAIGTAKHFWGGGTIMHDKQNINQIQV